MIYLFFSFLLLIYLYLVYYTFSVNISTYFLVPGPQFENSCSKSRHSVIRITKPTNGVEYFVHLIEFSMS